MNAVKVHFFKKFFGAFDSGCSFFLCAYPPVCSLFLCNLLCFHKNGGIFMTYAYARISSRDQNLDRQLSAFRSFGIPSKHIFCDKKSGKDFERQNYLCLIRKLKCGDLLVIKSIDRPVRSYDMIIEEWSRITNKIRADILVLDMPLLNTRAKSCSLVGKFISGIVLQVLSFVAETNGKTPARGRRKALRRQNGKASVSAVRPSAIRNPFSKQPRTITGKPSLWKTPFSARI